MADRYWVGGTDTWNATAGAKWALTSGGAGGQAVPTSSDQVFFDAASGAAVVTLSSPPACGSLNCTGFTGTLAGNTTLTVQGSFTLFAGMTYTLQGRIAFTGLSSGGTYNITTAGKTLVNNSGGGNGISVGTWNLLDSFTNSGSGSGLNIYTVTAFNTNNFNITLGSALFFEGTSGAVNLGSSTITLTHTSNILRVVNTGFTLNAGTSTIVIPNVIDSNSNLGFAGNGKTFYNVNITSTQVGLFVFTGTNTFNNLSFAGRTTAAGLSTYTFTGNQTVNGTFTVSAGTNATYRVFLTSDVVGTNRTITAAVVSLTDTDFQSITGAGAATWSGTRIGDTTGNSGITFPAAKTVYWGLLAGSQNWQAAGWATSSGGTPDINNFPLAQDTAVIDNSSTATTITGSTAYFVGTIDCSTRTSALTLSITGKNIIGNVTFGSGITATSFNNTFYGNAAQTLTTAGKTISNIAINKRSGSTLSLGDALTTTSTLVVNTGGFDAVIYNVTIPSFNSNSTSVRSLSMGTGLWTVTGTGTVWNIQTITNLTFTKGTANILLSDTTTGTRTFASSLIYNKLTIGGTTGTSTLTILGTNSFSEIASTKTVAHTVSFNNNATTTITTWSVTGTTGNVVTINSNTAGTLATLAITNKSSGIDYLAFQDINALPSNPATTPITFWAGANSTNNGNTRGIAFSSSSSTTQVYVLYSGTSFTTPVDWNNANNSIYIIGGGGGGSGSTYSSIFGVAGAGGGGGGVRVLANQTLSGTIPYAIGAGGTAGVGSTTTSTAGSGGTTTWNTTNTATGGTGGVSNLTSNAGTGGTGTFTGGSGGIGGSHANGLTGASGGGGGGGAAGVNGAGKNGGTGDLNVASSGGGGGNGGGTAGGNGTTTLSGSGGNNSLGTGGGASVTNAAGIQGVLGGGGSGGQGAFQGGNGGNGVDVSNGFGSGGGGGGGGATGSAGGLYGAGGGGGRQRSGSTSNGAAGAQGAIIIVYTLGSPPPITVNSNFFFLFG